MDNFFVSSVKGGLRGEITVPGDKSISHRSVMLGAIAQGSTVVNGCLLGADNLATIKAMKAMGVEVDVDSAARHVVIHGVGLHGLCQPTDNVDMGNSGTAMRLLTGLLSGQAFSSVLVGDASLMQRPMGRVVNPLREMNASIKMAENGTAPLKVKGAQKLHGIEYVLPVASAQVKSCLLLAGLYADSPITIIEPAPTRDHTERMLKTFGCAVTMDNNRVELIPGNILHAAEIDVPADISSAAFFMVAASITPGSELVLNKVGINPTRVGVINILRAMGADIELSNQRFFHEEPVADIVIRYKKLRGINIPQDQVPLAIDEFPVIFIAAACAEGTTVLRGARELRVKESDRIAAMAEGLQTLGVKSTVLDDGIIIEGGALLGGDVDSHDDHRVAMAFAVAGCVAKGPVTIMRCENVQTSFPDFVDLGQCVGMDLVRKSNE